MRVILNTRPLLFKKTGIGYYIHNLYRELLRSEEVEVCTTLGSAPADALGFMSKVSQAGRKIFGNKILKVSIPVGDFLISRAEKKPPGAEIYHETNYDVIPAGNWRSVANVYDLAFVKYPEFLPKEVVKKCSSNLTNVLKADRIIVNSQAVKKEVVSAFKIPDDLIDIIPLAPSGNYYPLNKAALEGKDRLRRSHGEYILYVGTIEPRKNIPTLLRAFRLLREKYDLKLIIAGGRGWLYEDILKMPHELGIQDSVFFTGYVEEKEILYLYNDAVAVVYPSFYEGFGLPVIEAMSCGVPVVISDIPSLREVAGDAALSFSPDDTEELVHTLEKVLSSETLRMDLRRKGLQRAKQYTWTKVAASTIQTYKRSLAR